MGHKQGFPWGMSLGCGLGLALGLVACTPAPSSPPSATAPSAVPTSAPTSSGSTGQTVAPSSGGSTTSPPATGTSEGAAAGGTLQLTLQAPGVPVQALCQGFAQNTGQVVSGGGDLGGATVRLGPVSLSGQNEFSMLPGEYSVHISCDSDADKWEGSGSAVIIRKEQRTLLGIELTSVP